MVGSAGQARAPTESGADELLTVAQVASDLQVVPGTVRSWIQSGALKSIRPGNGKQPGRTYRVRRADLDAFVAASQGPACAAEWQFVALGVAPSSRPRMAIEKTAG
jgi:excisionase family DNA binding protein